MLLSQVCPVPIIGILPYLKSIDEETIATTAIKNLDLTEIKKYL
jgi:hypothetical protein